MNEYTFQDCKVGLKESFQYIVNEQNQKTFCNVSGDVNPLHNDDKFAQKSGRPGRVVYGMLQGALYSQLVGVHLPGKYCLLQDIKISFMRPAYINDILTVVGEIVDVDERYNRVFVKAYILNQNKKKVSRALISVGIMK